MRWVRGALFLLVLAISTPAGAATRVLAWGDSLTAGNDWGAWVQLWQPNWIVEDHGVAGEASWNAACGVEILAADGCRFQEYLATYTYQPGDVFVFLWGTNDVRFQNWHWTGTLSGPQPPDGLGRMNQLRTRQALEQIVDDALATGAEVVIGVPPPFLWTVDSPHVPERVDQLNRHLTDILRGIVQDVVEARPGVRIFDAYLRWETLPDWPHPGYYRQPDGTSDGIHPGSVATDSPSGEPGDRHLAEVIHGRLLSDVPVSSLAPLLVAAGAILVAAALRLGRDPWRRRGGRLGSSAGAN